MAPELCDSADFLSTFQGGRRGHSWKENSPEGARVTCRSGCRGIGIWRAAVSHCPPPRTLGGRPEQVLVQQKPQPRARQHVQHCRWLAGI